MKKGLVVVALLSGLFLGFTPSGTGNLEKHGTYQTKPGKNSQRGAEDVYVLSRTVFNAVKMNDFDMLATYVPTDSEIEYLRKQSTERDRYLFEEMTHEGLRANTRLNFDNLVNEGMEKGINWSEVEIQESKISMCKVGDQHMCEALMTLQDLKGNNLRVSFDMIRIKERWFLFQGVRLKNDKASAR